MTTIAFDGRYLAADTQVNGLSGKSGIVSKLMIPSHPVTFLGDPVKCLAVAGGSKIAQLMMRHVDMGKDLGVWYPELVARNAFIASDKVKPWSMIAVCETDTYTTVRSSKSVELNIERYSENPFSSIRGSGRCIASTLIWFNGLSAIDAVNAAALIDPDTGGSVMWIDTVAPQLSISSKEMMPTREELINSLNK